jgi:hypothetical protein
MEGMSSCSSESCQPATRAAIEDCSTIIEAALPLQSLVMVSSFEQTICVSWATVGCYLYAIIHSCHGLTPMMRSTMCVCCLLEPIYIVVCEAIQYQTDCSTTTATPNTYSIVCASNQRSRSSQRSLAAKRTRFNGDTCFVRGPAMLHRSDSNSHPSSFLHITISIWRSQPNIS